MSVDSIIAKQDKNGAVRVVWCHFNGWLSHNGKLLLENYNTPEKIDALIDMGSMVHLGFEIGDKPHTLPNPTYVKKGKFIIEHYFNSPCTFYGRDKNEDNFKSTRYKSLANMKKNESAAFCYLWNGRGWKWCEDGHWSKLRLLKSTDIND